MGAAKTPEKEAEIISTVDIPSRIPDRAGKIDLMITYRLGPYQSGMVIIPKETATEKTIQDAVKKDVETKAKYVGLRFKV